MKIFLPMTMAAAILAAGCASHEPAFDQQAANLPPSRGPGSPTELPAGGASSAAQSLIITPGAAFAGKILVYNPDGRFVVAKFPIGQMPAVDQRLFVYRQGLKVGEIKITGPQKDDNTVADLAEGEAQPGDDVRDR